MKILKLFVFLLAALPALSAHAQQNSLKAGAQCPDFTYQDINGKTYTLKDFAGRYIFIDAWASWCGPCKQEIPHLQALEKAMHGKKIAFVSLSLDSNRQQWETFVKQNGLTGIQLYNGNEARFVSAFDIQTIPRFILIGPDGKVVEPQAMRPSQGTRLTDYLNALPGIR